MFTEFAGQVWTTSATGAAVTTNTDETRDGSSQKIVFTGADAWALSTFTEFDPTGYEEISLQIYCQDTVSLADIFTITINGEDHTFTRLKSGWNHILIDCADWTDPVSTMKITCLVDSMIMFVDVAGYRKTTYESMDLDIIEAIKAAISLDYDFETTLTENADEDAESISLTDSSYINNTTLLRLTDGSTTEDVRLLNKEGALATPLENSYDKNTTVVTALCPILSEDHDDAEPNPICGIKIFDQESDREEEIVETKGVSSPGAKLKQSLGALKVIIYIECTAKKKFFGLCRQFDNNYGKAFYILLDGELIEIYTDNVVFSDVTDLGNLPRKAWFYSIKPQPFTVSRKREIETITLDFDSEVLS